MVLVYYIRVFGYYILLLY